MSIQENHTSGLIYFMPYWVFESEDLSSTDKLVYSLLTGLAHSNEHKECYPTDEYIGHRLKITPNHANECLLNLEKFGAIKRRRVRNGKNPLKQDRFIRVYLERQKIFTNTEKSEPGTSEKSENPTSEKSEPSNKDIYRSKRSGCADKSTQPKVDKSPLPSADALEFMRYFISKLKEKKPNIRIGSEAKWIKECVKLLKIRKLEHLNAIVAWIASSPASFAYIQSPAKLYEKLDQQEMMMESQQKKKRSGINRTYALFMKEQDPKTYEGFSFDSSNIYNLNSGKALPLDLEPDEFKKDFANLWGGKR